MPDSEDDISSEESLPPTNFERLTEDFYLWEKRGRGWWVWDYPVELEPPFRPFLIHGINSGRMTDDAQRPTYFSSLLDKLKDSFSGTPPALPSPNSSTMEDELYEPEPASSAFDDSPLAEFTVSVPPEKEVYEKTAEQFLLSLSGSQWPISFEILATARSIRTGFVTRETDKDLLNRQLRGHFPEAVILESNQSLNQNWDQEGKETVIVDFGLSQEFMRPLKAITNFQTDPLVGIVASLENVRENEVALLQVLFQAVRNPWADSMIRSVTDWHGKSFFMDAPEMVHLAKEKIEHPLYAVIIRLAAQSPTEGRALELVRSIGSALSTLACPGSNELIPLDNEGYTDALHCGDVLDRKTHRSGMILNSQELVSLAHLPSVSVRSEKLHRMRRKTKAAPELAVGHGLVLGENVHNEKVTHVSLSPEQRVQHTYVIGASGTGKTTFLLNLIIQDIQHGNGIGVLDPHGQLIDQILPHIPEERHGDVILFNPQDAEFPIGLNILTAHSDLEKTLLASDLVGVFKRSSLSWGDQMNGVLTNAILAFLENPRGGTLIDLRRFLLDKDFREEYLQGVLDPEVVFYWKKEFSLLIGRPEVPILTRLNTFLGQRIIRNIVSQKENRINFREVMDSGKIFLCKLSQGGIGEENAHLLGSLIVSKFQQMVMSRQDVDEEDRRHFFLYIDEFQNFVTPSMEAILSGARKYRLGLVLAHQNLQQVWGKNRDLANSVMSNPYTRICFRMDDLDAKKLKDGFSLFGAQDFQNLGKGQAICRVERAEYDFNLTTSLPIEIQRETAKIRAEAVKRLSREKYARKREDIEQENAIHLENLEPTKAPLKEPVTRDKPKKSKEASSKDGISTEQREFLEYVLRNPGSFVTKIYEALQLSGYKGDRIKEELIKKGLMAQEETRRGTGGRVAKVLTLTPKSLEILSEKHTGKGGQKHKDSQLRIRDLAALYGWTPKIEERIDGSRESVDVGLTKGDLRVAVEISVTTDVENEIENIKKCLNAGYDYIICVKEGENNLNGLKKGVRKLFNLRERERIHLCQYQEVEKLLRVLAGEGVVSGRTRVYSPDRNQNQLWDVKQAADFLGVPESTIYTWVSKKVIPYVKVGRLTKFRPKDLEQWVEQRKVSEQSWEPKEFS